MESKIQTTLKENKDNQAIVEVVVPVVVAEEARQKVLKELAKETTIKGFRKGKAPLSLVDKELDPSKVLEKTINSLLPQILTAALKNHELSPLANPHIHLIEAKRTVDWKFELEIPLQPKLDLKGYQEYLKGELATAQIWTPGKGDVKEEKSKEQLQEEKLRKLFEALLKKYKFAVPEMMVEDEINRSLSRLLQQIQTLGLSIEDYLKSIGKTSEQLRAEYHKSAEESLQLEVLLARISHEMAIKVEAKEIEAMVEASGDENAKKQLKNPDQVRYIGEIIRKRKTIDTLLNL